MEVLKIFLRVHDPYIIFLYLKILKIGLFKMIIISHANLNFSEK